MICFYTADAAMGMMVFDVGSATALSGTFKS